MQRRIKMKKLTVISILFLLFALYLFNGCGGDAYSEMIKLNTQFTKLMETYLGEIEKADNANAVAKAMNKCADGMEKVWPKMKAFSEAHPELKDSKNQPDSLKKSNKEAEVLGRRMGSVYGKIMPYMQDENVRKAQERLMNIMQ